MHHRLVNIIVIFCSLVASHGVFAETANVDLPLKGMIMTADKQQQMTPKQALLRLKEGNQRFLTHTQIARDYLKQAHQSSYGQFPFAVVLNCMDSRSVPELFFDQGLADLFTLRVAGNVLNEDILGSMEFATKVVGSRLIVVLAHTSCGAIAGACSDVKLGHLTNVLDKIQPSVSTGMETAGTKNCTDPKLVDAIAKLNALRVVKEIQDKSPIIAEMVKNKQVGIVAGLHDIKTGQVEFFEEKRSVPE